MKTTEKSTTKLCVGQRSIFVDDQYKNLADTLLEKAQELQQEYWVLAEKMKNTAYPIFMEQMQDAQRLGKLAQAILELQNVNGTLRHITGILR